MLSLSQTARYAVLALGCLDECGDSFLLAKEISECTGIPRPYFLKILNTLAQTGLVIAKRGSGGGFTLGRHPKEISVLEAIEAVEGRQWKPQCLMGIVECSDERACPLHGFWKVQQTAIHDELNRVTVSEIAEFERISRILLKGCACNTCSDESSDLKGTESRFDCA